MPGDCSPTARWEPEIDALAAAYRTAQPFPHIVLDDFFDRATIARAVAAFPSPDSARWKEYRHVNARKLGNTDRRAFPEAIGSIVDALNAPAFVTFLSRLTGVDDLLADPTLEGGGMHQSARGGFLNVHVDFTAHPHHRDWRRRVNVLLYLNEVWDDAYGGHLELWAEDMSRCVRSIAPISNRCVIFTLGPTAFHGHPAPIACPPDHTRKSIATYYYTAESAVVSPRSTDYRARPGDGLWTRGLIATGTLALQIYARAKRGVYRYVR
jgi:hypothetical protein